MVKNLHTKAKKKKKERKKEQTFSSHFSSTHNKHFTKRERESKCREKKKMSENIINKDNNKQMTTRERQHIEVAKLEAELNALKVDAFAKVRRCCFFFFLRWLCVLNHMMMRSRRARSARCLLGFQRQQQPAKSPNAFTSARAADEE